MSYQDSHKELWVSPAVSKGAGTFDEPYTFRQALERVQPGNTIILKHGTYNGDFTIECSGTIDKPIRITAQENATVEIAVGCWYFYDTSDLIVSGITFRGSPASAVAVMGACTRNNFQSISFIDCCTHDRASSTFFIGGAGAQCNVIEHCRFSRSHPSNNAATSRTVVGIMIAEGDEEQENGLIRDHVVRYNLIENYDCGVMVGTRGSGQDQFGHLVENNVIRGCSGDGIKVNCGDTEIRGNTIVECGGRGIWIATGTASSVEDNRVEKCLTGVTVLSAGHIVWNNCIVDSLAQAIHVTAIPRDCDVDKSTIIIEQNSLIQFGERPDGDAASGVLMDSLSSCVVRKNLFFGPGTPYVVPEETSREKDATISVIQDNVAGGSCEAKDGFSFEEVTFTDPDRRDFHTDSSYGARGWITASDTEEVLSVEPGEGAPELLTEEQLTEVERLITDVDREDVVERSLLKPQDEENYDLEE